MCTCECVCLCASVHICVCTCMCMREGGRESGYLVEVYMNVYGPLELVMASAFMYNI